MANMNATVFFSVPVLQRYAALSNLLSYNSIREHFQVKIAELSIFPAGTSIKGSRDHCHISMPA